MCHIFKEKLPLLKFGPSFVQKSDCMHEKDIKFNMIIRNDRSVTRLKVHKAKGYRASLGKHVLFTVSRGP